MLDHCIARRSGRRRRRKTPLVEALVSIVTADICCKSPLRVDGDKEHWTLELDSDSQSWKSWKNHDHLCSSAGKADETEEEEATRTSVA